MRFTALFPLACAITAFVLSLFCILAGDAPGYMEDYHIVALNTSTLGHNLLNTTSNSSSSGSISSWLNGVVSSIEGDITSIENDLVDKLAAKLGIKQWYSLHMMDLCEGNFSPNASTPGADYNVTSCTNKTTMYHFDPAAIINSELQAGDLHINITTLQWPQVLTDGIQAINILLDVTFVLYCIGIAACGLVIIFSTIAFFLPSAYSYTATTTATPSRFISVLAGLLAMVAFLALGIASAIVTVFMVKVVDLVGQYGRDIGVYAYKGGKFLAITWASTGVMLLSVVAWGAECCFRQRMKRREWVEKPVGRSSWMSVM